MIIIAADSLGAAPIIMGNELARRNHSILLVKIFFKKTYMCIYIYLFTQCTHVHALCICTYIMGTYMCVCVCVSMGMY